MKRWKWSVWCSGCIAFLLLSCNLQAQYAYRTVVGGLDTPWEILWGPDNWIWCTERYGRISRIHPETGEQRILAIIDQVAEVSESGLMGMALHPNFADSPFVYVVYTYRNQQNQLRNRVVAYRYAADSLFFDRILLDGMNGWSIHDGARLLVLEDHTLLVTMGDAGQMQDAQNLSSLNGKILRIRLDGSIPPDNPFPGSPVYAYGLRNSQGLVVANGWIYVSEHGPSSDDEVNRILKGRNYGWPNVLGWCDTPDEQQFCQEHAVVEPLIAWTPTLAVCGMDYYSGEKFPEWQHSLLLTTLKASRLVQLRLNDAGDSILEVREYFSGTFGRLRDLCISPDGRVFIATSNRDGRARSPFPLPEDDRIIELLPQPASTPEKHKGQGWWKIEKTPGGISLSLSAVDCSFPMSLSVYDSVGRIWWKRTLNGPEHCRIPVPPNTPQWYFLHFVAGTQSWVIPFLF